MSPGSLAGRGEWDFRCSGISEYVVGFLRVSVCIWSVREFYLKFYLNKPTAIVMIGGVT